MKGTRAMSTPERQQDDDHEKLGGYGGTHVAPEKGSLLPDGSASDAAGVDYPAHPGEPEDGADDGVREPPA